ncbi:tryptophan--tRNA ligase [Archaeoglobales archaeon]|nr:MAG: tryptophan--tRNA ligase [Archaeoglobales archaeon]
MATITPWEVEGVVDYDRLIQEFGMQPFSYLLDKIPNPNWLMRRNIIFGHRDYERIIDAILNKKSWAVMSGFMPSGLPHFGHKMTMDEIVWHQKVGGKAFVGIADMEAHAVRGLSWQKVTEIGFEYIKSIIALGLDENAIIYFQSASDYVKDLAFELSAEVNWSELKAIYGFTSETNLAKMFVTSVQAADILHPQLKEFGGPKPVVIPVGADQDPHIRLTRDLAARISLFSMERIENGLRIRSRKGAELLDHIKSLNFEKKIYEEHIDLFGDVNEIESEIRRMEIEIGGYAFIPPSSTYHKFTTGLTGGKMSSSKPESYISLLDEPKEAVKKVIRAFTGGRVSAEEQRKLGGKPDRCTIFELYSYHLIKDDVELQKIYDECRGGRLLCGKCKKMAAELVEEFLKEHQEKRNQVEGELDKYNIIVRNH